MLIMWMSHVTHMWMSHVTHMWMSHVTHMWMRNTSLTCWSCHAHVNQTYSTRVNVSRLSYSTRVNVSIFYTCEREYILHVWTWVVCEGVMCHTREGVMLDSCEWVMSHISMSHVPHIDESCPTYRWVMPHTMDESCPTRVDKSFHTHVNESCHTQVRTTSRKRSKPSHLSLEGPDVPSRDGMMSSWLISYVVFVTSSFAEFVTDSYIEMTTQETVCRVRDSFHM